MWNAVCNVVIFRSAPLSTYILLLTHHSFVRYHVQDTEKIIFWFFALSIGIVVLYRFVPIPLTPLMVIRMVEQKREGEDLRWKYQWRSYDNISPHLPLAVFCAEDQNFLEHNGFDKEAIQKAVEHNRKGKRIRGGSTISQQVAKMPSYGREGLTCRRDWKPTSLYLSSCYGLKRGSWRFT